LLDLKWLTSKGKGRWLGEGREGMDGRERKGREELRKVGEGKGRALDHWSH